MSFFYLRFFGWSILSFICAFIFDNFLIVNFNFPGAFNLFHQYSHLSLIEVFLYLLFILFGFLFLKLNSNNSLRDDANLLHNINLYLIRSSFWIVLLIGISDFTISFLRVESFFNIFFDKDIANNFTRPIYVGNFVHFPLMILGFLLGLFTKTLGFHWLSLLIVVSELIIVIARFIFSYEQTFMGDLVRYWYAALFLFASAYTLYDDAHVRVDILYANMLNKTKGIINSIGSIVLGVSTALVIIFVGLNGKQAIINSPVLIFEVTQQGSVGMFVKYQLAIFLGVFAVTMLIQFISLFFESLADIDNLPGKREIKSQIGN